MICARLLIYSKAAGLFIACCCPRCLCCRLKYNQAPARFRRQQGHYGFLEDNRDNDNNRKNGRNCGCHEVT